MEKVTSDDCWSDKIALAPTISLGTIWELFAQRKRLWAEEKIDPAKIMTELEANKSFSQVEKLTWTRVCSRVGSVDSAEIIVKSRSLPFEEMEAVEISLW